MARVSAGISSCASDGSDPSNPAAERLRLHPHALRELGPVEEWPATLRSTLRVVLNAPSPMFLWCGSDFVDLHNAACARLLRGPEGGEIGCPARFVWKAVWREWSQAAEAVTQRGVPAQVEAVPYLVEDAEGPVEAYLSLSCNPIRDENGRVLGVLGACVDETQREVRGRRLALLSALGSVLSDVRGEGEVLVALDRCLREDGRDLPFAALYVFGENSVRARLVGVAGAGVPTPAFPSELESGASGIVWPGGAPIAVGREVDVDVLGIAREDLPTGPWEIPPKRIKRLDLPDASSRTPVGFLLAGINPFHRAEEEADAFIESVGRTVGAAIGRSRRWRDGAVDDHAREEIQRVRAPVEGRESEVVTEAAKARDEFERVFAGVNDFVGIFDHDWRCRHVDPRIAARIGKRPQEIQGQVVWEVFPDLVGTDLELEMRASLSTRRPRSFEFFDRMSKQWFYIHIHPERHEIRLFGTDVTDRKRAEEAVKESEERLRFAMETGKLGVWDWDLRTNLISWSDSLYALHGLAPGEFDGTMKSFSKLVHPEDLERVERAIERGIQQDQTYNLEFRIARADGGITWVYTNARVLRDADARPRRMLGVTIDITDQKEVELAAQESALQLRLATDATALGIWDYSPREDVLTWDRRTRELFGMTPSARISQEIYLERIHPEDRARVKEATFQALDPAGNGHYDVSFRVNHGDRRPERWVRATGQALFQGGVPVRFIGTAEDITEDQKAADAMRRLGAIVESSDDAILGKDLQGRITSWNRAAESLYGYTAAEVIGQPITLLIPKDRVDEAFQILARVREGERIEHFETVRMRKDGSCLTVSVSVSPIKDASGRIIGVSKIARDITAQKANEEALQNQTRRLEILNRVGSTLAAEFDLDRIVHAVTDAGRETSGAAFGAFFESRDDGDRRARFKSFSGTTGEAFGASGFSALLHLFAPVLRGEQVVRIDDIQAERSLADGDLAGISVGGDIPVRSFLAVPITSRSGQHLGGLLFGHHSPGGFTEESERMLLGIAAQASIAIDNANLYRELEHELDEHRRAEDALRESEERFRTLADNIAQIAWTAGPDGKIFWFNKRWFEFTGESLHADGSWSVRETIHPDHVDRVREKYERHIASGEAWEDTFPMQGALGGYRWFLSQAIPIRDADGTVLRWFGTNTDINALREAELKLERARDEALAASRAKDEFLAALSHELRTPLNPVLLIASDAAANPDLPDAVRADFEIVRKSISLEARLIDDLLDLTRITQGKLSLDLDACDAHGVLHDALATVDPERREKRIDLEMDLGADRSSLPADPVRLQQVFWNVLKNAVKFTPTGGCITLTTSNDAATGDLVVVVTDTGIGMQPDEITYIFNAFSQGRHADSGSGHRFGGLGLGLAISHRVVELHGGSISAASGGRGAGSTFTIRLPQAASSVEAARSSLRDRETSIASTGDTSEPVAEASAGRQQILLVEDHAPTRLTLKQLLVRRNFAVTTAGSLTEALDLARRQRIDLLVSDIGLPDGDGHMLVEKLRSWYPDLPAIALSGYGMKSDVARSQAAGFSRHITKPIDVAVLDQVIGDLLNGR